MSSTRAHTHASVATALGALSRELHGGANAQVMEMLLGMGEVGNVRPWVARRLEGGERVIGMGHAVNKTDDPGAKFFAPCQRGLGNGWESPSGMR